MRCRFSDPHGSCTSSTVRPHRPDTTEPTLLCIDSVLACYKEKPCYKEQACYKEKVDLLSQLPALRTGVLNLYGLKSDAPLSPSRPLPAGYIFKEMVYWKGPSETLKSGDRVVHGESGVVVQAGYGEWLAQFVAGDDMLISSSPKVMMLGNRRIHSLNNLSRSPPPRCLAAILARCSIISTK